MNDTRCLSTLEHFAVISTNELARENRQTHRHRNFFTTVYSHLQNDVRSDQLVRKMCTKERHKLSVREIISSRKDQKVLKRIGLKNLLTGEWLT